MGKYYSIRSKTLEFRMQTKLAHSDGRPIYSSVALDDHPAVDFVSRGKRGVIVFLKTGWAFKDSSSLTGVHARSFVNETVARKWLKLGLQT